MENNTLPWGRLTGIRPAKIARKLYESGLSEAEVTNKFLQYYEADNYRSRLAASVAKREIELMDGMYENGVSLYVGIPFCPSRCAYCSFISFSVEKTAELMEPYLAALQKEIESCAELLAKNNRTVETVYIGGGTPTTLSADSLDFLIKSLKSNFDLSKIKEFSVEAGRPDTITREKLEVLKSNGVTRISLNPQTTNPEVLKTIGRRHTVEQFFDSFSEARKMGFDNINTDVIAGLPGESVESFKKTIDDVIALEPKEITVHTMSLKRASVINQNIDGYSITEGSIVGEMLSYAAKKLDKFGFLPYYMYRQKNILGGYENVGFAKPNFECLYNVYIMEEVQSILALGAGGSTKVILPDDIERIFNVKEPTEYIRRIDNMIERKFKEEHLWITNRLNTPCTKPQGK